MLASRKARVAPPLQDRSRRTLEKIGRALERLLATRSFDDISVADIVREARCSVGSFYARFESKDDLLPYVYERYDAELKPRIQTRLASVDWSQLSFEATVRLLVEGTVDMFTERRHLLRAVALLARNRPKEAARLSQPGRSSTTDMPAVLLSRFRERIPHDDPMEAARVGFFMVAAVAREKILFGEAPHAASTAMNDDRLKRELTRMLYGYLTAPDL